MDSTIREQIRTHYKVLIGILVLVGILAFATYTFFAPGGMLSGLHNDLKAIEPMAGFEYTDLDGNIIDLTDFKGKPLVVNSWASWIPFSQTELPLLARMGEEYGDKVTILAINRMEPIGTIRAFQSAFTLPASLRMLIDPSDNFYKVVGGYAMPETVVFDAEGVIVYHVRGTLTESDLRAHIDGLLAE
jgi:thiol-disulfide isomerase/thioredoxin